MDPSNNPRGRGRKGSTFPTSFPITSSPQNPPDQSTEQQPSSSADYPLHFTFETPSPSASREKRMRARNLDSTGTMPEDSASKGGRSLRKRPRVDYTFDQLEDLESYGAKSTPSAIRTLKRRKTDSTSNENEANEDLDVRTSRRASEQPQPSSSRKRNTRKSTAEPQAYVPEQHVDDAEVRDTIEVGGRRSGDSDESMPQESQPKVATGNEVEPQEQQGEAEEDISDTDGDNFEPDLLDYLTPYIDGSFVFYPDYQDDEVELPGTEAEPEVDAEVDLNAEAEANSGVEVNHEADPEAGLEPEDGAEVLPAEEDAAVEDTPAETVANSPTTELEAPGTQSVDMKQFRFKKTRDASEFTDLFKDIKSLTPKELYRRVEAANKALVAWQEEYNELRKFTDDFDNSVRYQKEEDAFNRRFKATVARDPNANPIQKDFVIKGIRAKETVDPEIAYTRQQDRIMANIYGFEYDPRADKVGRQDPIAQRTGLSRHGRLRERPKQTAKAAEAEDPNILPGKRTRKPPERFTEGEAASRGATPVPTQRRGRRGAQAQENGDEYHNQQNQSQPQPLSQTASVPNVAPESEEQEQPKKRGKGGRPRKPFLVVPESQSAPTPGPEQDEVNSELEPTTNLRPKVQMKTAAKSQPKSGPKAKPATEPTAQLSIEPQPEPVLSLNREAEEVGAEEEQPRKRKRKAPANTTAVAEEEEESNLQNGAEPLTPSKPARRTNSRKSDIPSGSFKIATPRTVASTNHYAEEPRPLTASSTATAETVASTSNYQLREKRQRKFTNNINEEDSIEEPKPKRTKRAPKKIQTKVEDLTPAPEPEPAPAPQIELKSPAPKPPTKIKFKVKNQHPAFPPALSTPPLVPSNPPPTHTNYNNNINGNSNSDSGSNGFAGPNTPDGEIGADPNKDYNSMTKSEKMSHSMKARWASGSMNTAVAKRRATLAAKKQSAKPPTGGNSTACNQGGTPTSRSTPGGDEDDDPAALRQ
ncbi:uncharacterized protein F4812DRAFT_462702 [Daldinia caldariorum]|uniref:uncharacterized protein n=1 Tax=Daldinia caldariorum TaxID=326644 RepID=UPI002007D465|nr:uncharacterized protein F4812DRAFT_462702 [Daldinia caldariorum]KAI1464287.1 hypothetical protein F4812DRAFT_462702 [Daldinia caldariorum]